ncbi:hypothetical protein [Halopiger goleimassiliensis]|uniref:hypothetical protein n=1 Tax=Halopiger goleimassiliensis TaxID=1293048 RepID=UPI00067797C6|nr:hypothetical protein [Halopiger goleimassiliensis]
MGDRSDELTESRDPASTDDLLDETDRLLSGTGEGATDSGLEDRDPAADPVASPGTADASVEPEPSQSRSRSLLGRVLPSLPDDLFSPKAFLAFALLVGVGLIGGNTVIPFASIGGLIGVFALTFAAGLFTSKRRYLEVTLAGAAAGGVANLLTTGLTVAIAVSFATPLLVGAGVGVVSSVLGYYFGRDLRRGLARDVE